MDVFPSLVCWGKAKADKPYAHFSLPGIRSWLCWLLAHCSWKEPLRGQTPARLEISCLRIQPTLLKASWVWSHTAPQDTDNFPVFTFAWDTLIPVCFYLLGSGPVWPAPI